MNSKFESFLKELPNVSGIGMYFIETANGYINYNEITHTFQKLQDFGGYRQYSQSGIMELSNEEKENLESDIEKNYFVFTAHYKDSRGRIILYNGFKEGKK
jgi:hypothetical protein